VGIRIICSNCGFVIKDLDPSEACIYLSKINGRNSGRYGLIEAIVKFFGMRCPRCLARLNPNPRNIEVRSRRRVK